MKTYLENLTDWVIAKFTGSDRVNFEIENHWPSMMVNAFHLLQGNILPDCVHQGGVTDETIILDELGSKCVSLISFYQCRREAHNNAISAFSSDSSSALPLALYLRPYSRQAFNIVDKSLSDGRGIYTHASVWNLQGENVRLFDSLNETVRLVQLANHASGNRYSIPSFSTYEHNWRSCFKDLSRVSSAIVVDLTKASSGILWELDTIRSTNQQSKTLVVVSKELDTMVDLSGFLSIVTDNLNMEDELISHMQRILSQTAGSTQSAEDTLPRSRLLTGTAIRFYRARVDSTFKRALGGRCLKSAFTALSDAILIDEAQWVAYAAFLLGRLFSTLKDNNAAYAVPMFLQSALIFKELGQEVEYRQALQRAGLIAKAPDMKELTQSAMDFAFIYSYKDSRALLELWNKLAA